ncbi:MAG TPA: GNAT family N-acetyltransferase [Candidatus Limnocylindria bacterium]|jgi:GNAT superfamily N-acetyltransferase
MPTARASRPADAGIVAKIWLASFGATYSFPPAHSVDQVRAWVAERLLPDTETWIAEERGTAIGFISIGGRSIEQLYLLPEQTGRGIGSMLMTLAKERRPTGLELWTFQVNEGARRFYVRHGFHVAELTDGADNEEQQPDVRYVWP